MVHPRSPEQTESPRQEQVYYLPVDEASAEFLYEAYYTKIGRTQDDPGDSTYRTDSEWNDEFGDFDEGMIRTSSLRGLDAFTSSDRGRIVLLGPATPPPGPHITLKVMSADFPIRFITVEKENVKTQSVRENPVGQLWAQARDAVLNLLGASQK